MKGTLLLIDDDRDLATLLGAFFAQEGFRMLWAERPSQAWELLEQDPDLVLLDVMLPEADGFEVCQALRKERSVPILMLTARGDEQDRIRGLRLGADDYLPKPFNPEELLARVEAILRRAPRPVGDCLDPETRRFVLDRRGIDLTPTEYRILEAMVRQPGRCFARDQLLDLLDEAGACESFDRSIDIHISRLRGKIESEPKQPKHLLTVRGLGYRFQW
ncbi:MAG TPA: DNA-binding response regulator [Cyanobacteria bacterium UBA8530]|nr:DNA-binding response regulator [Cyanobacteria bacterium UBA8530]